MSLSSSERELLKIIGRLVVSHREPKTRRCSQELSELLRLHHLRPLAHSDGVQDLDAATQECALIAAFHHRTLEQVGSAFAARDIPWTTIKGAAYAWRLYESPELRPMSDVDVLVREVDFARACQVLRDLDFAERSVSVRTRHAQTFYRASHEIVDLHRTILQPLRGGQGMSRAWKRARPDDSHPGHWQLDLVDLCWIHIAHMARHEFVVPLVSYVDLQRLLLALSVQDKENLDQELGRMRLDYARVVAMRVITVLHEGSIDIRSPRMRLVVPRIEELLTGRHHGRGGQILKKLALFPHDSLALGAGWVLRIAEDTFMRYRAK